VPGRKPDGEYRRGDCDEAKMAHVVLRMVK
jgi:hypothetical protein